MQRTRRRRCDEEIKKKNNVQIAFAPIFVTIVRDGLDFGLTNKYKII